MEKAISQIQTNSASQLNTVKNKIEGFTKNEVIRAQEARRLYNQLVSPNIENMKMIIFQNLIKNCPVTTEDVNVSNRIIGPDISTLKGIYTCPKSFHVIDDSIDIPEKLIIQNQLLDLAIDVIFIKTQPMLTTIDISIKHRCFVSLDDRTSEELYCGLENDISHYNRAVFL